MSQGNANIVQARFLADIVVLQQTTAPVSLEIGTVINGTVENGVITVTRAPGAIVSRIISIADSLGVLYSLVQRSTFAKSEGYYLRDITEAASGSVVGFVIISVSVS